MVTESAKIQAVSTAEVRAQLENSLGFTSEAGLSLSYYYSALEDITAANPQNTQMLFGYISASIELSCNGMRYGSSSKIIAKSKDQRRGIQAFIHW